MAVDNRLVGRCGARTRRGTACLCKGAGRGGRCKFHGGASTGPKTEAGRAKISALQRARWKVLREEREALKILQQGLIAGSSQQCARKSASKGPLGRVVAEEIPSLREGRDGGRVNPIRPIRLPRLTVNPGRDRYGRGHK